MKVGNKVKVKSWEEISKTLNKEHYCLNPCKNGEATRFDKKGMFKYVNLTGTISKIDNNTGNVQIKFTGWICSLWWHPCWLDLIPKEKLKKSLTQTNIKYLETQIKTENYENKLQRKKSIVIRGTVPEGSITCGRKRKTSIAVGYLSNSVCIGG